MFTNRLRGARLPLKVTSFLGVAVAALVLASSASAVNVAPNPGFETDCAGVPCGWTGNSGQATRDTTQKHNGVASLKLATPALPSPSPAQANAQTACINTSFPAGALPLGYWYRANAGVSGLAMIVNAYTAAGCGTGGLGQLQLQPGSVDTSGVWRRVEGSVTLTSPAASVKITLSIGCTTGCTTSKTANFDDVAVGQAPPTAVTLVSFRGTRTARGVRLAWKTAAASHVVGFNVYRGQTRVNRTLIASTRGLTGSYVWLDRTAARTTRSITYRLQAVGLDGTRTWLGSARVS